MSNAHGSALLEALPAMTQDTAYCVDGPGGMAVVDAADKPVGQLDRGLIQRRNIARGKLQYGFGFPLDRRWTLFLKRGFLKNDVAIGASHPKGAYAGAARFLSGGPWLGPLQHEKRAVLQPQIRVGFLEVRRWREFAMRQGENSANQTPSTCRSI